MPKIAKILLQARPERVVIPVLTDEGEEAEITIYIGQHIETWFDAKYNKVKARIKRHKLDASPR